MKNPKGLNAIVNIVVFIIAIMSLQTNTVRADRNQSVQSETYDVILTLVKVKHLDGWPKGANKDSYTGQQLNIKDYFGAEVETIDGVYFEVHQDSEKGKLIQTGKTQNGGQLIFKGLKAGRYAITANQEKSDLAVDTSLGEATPVPLTIELPVLKPDGTWFTTGDNALHVYPKQVLKQKKKEISYKVKKVWRGRSLSSVTVYLKQDGKKIDSIKLNATNNWEYTFTNLAEKTDAGRKITYSAEEEVPNDYSASYQKMTGEAGTVITNSLTPTTPPSKTPIIKTGTLTIYWLLGIAIILIGLGYKLYQNEKH